jgi:polyferredoxin
VAGRLWCGYTCPQTVYTEIFMWAERQIEGDRIARMRWTRAPGRSTRSWRKGAKQGAWDGHRAVDRLQLRRLLHADPRAGRRGHGGLGPRPWETFWVLFYGFATYGNAGFLREQVCKYMCPYARFQSAMFDKDTLIISYDAERGEPRGTRAARRI